MANVALAYQIVIPEPIDDAHDVILTRVAPGLAKLWKFSVTGDTGNSVTFTRRYTPTWAVVLAIIGFLVFLLGLLFLLVKTEDVLVFSLAPEGETKTKLTVTGTGPDKVPELISGLGDPVRVGPSGTTTEVPQETQP